LVGLFVLTSLVSLIGYVFWMGKYGINENKYLTYKTDLYEAVS
jgi:hypothetical protein